MTATRKSRRRLDEAHHRQREAAKTLAEVGQRAAEVTPEIGEVSPSEVSSVRPPAEWDAYHLTTIDGWVIKTSDECPQGMCHVDQDNAIVTLRLTDWGVITEYFGTDEFLDHATDQETGMRRVISDAGKYRKAAQHKERANGSDQADRLTALAQRANGLLVQAASLNAQASAYQLETFSTRLGELREEYAELEAELEQTRELINLAATAVVDASE